MTSGARVSLRCPDCGKAAGALGESRSCPGCGRGFAATDGVWNLLPGALGLEPAGEDRLHETPGLATWRRLFFHKRYWVEWCDTRWLPPLLGPGPRTFLELGGGLCYASALAKERLPSALVVATDVSPRYLAGHARRTGEILGAPADVYAAVDAATLPFEDRQFDVVYSQVVLYRLADPVRALGEIRRVLAPGGRYFGVERASPWGGPFFRREAREMRARAAAHGIGERPLRFRDWQAVAERAGLGRRAVQALPGGRVRSARLRRLGNAVRPIYVAIRGSG